MNDQSCKCIVRVVSGDCDPKFFDKTLIMALTSPLDSDTFSLFTTEATMNRNEIYAAYVARANAANVKPKANTSFQSKQAIIDATAALPVPPPVAATKSAANRTLSNIVLSGKSGFIHEKLDPTQRARARRWWGALETSSCPVEHEHRARWSVSRVPAELCRVLGVKCHAEPRS